MKSLKWYSYIHVDLPKRDCRWKWDARVSYPVLIKIGLQVLATVLNNKQRGYPDYNAQLKTAHFTCMYIHTYVRACKRYQIIFKCERNRRWLFLYSPGHNKNKSQVETSANCLPQVMQYIQMNLLTSTLLFYIKFHTYEI